MCVGDLRQPTEVRCVPARQEETQLLGEARGVVLRAWLCRLGRGIRKQNHYRHGDVFGQQEIPVVAYPVSCGHVGKQVTPELEVPAKGRKLRRVAMAHIAGKPCLPRKAGNRIGILQREEKHHEPSQPNDPFHFLPSRPAGIRSAGADVVEFRIRE
jgi:hypothetical protein